MKNEKIVGLIDNNFKLVFSNLKLAKQIVKMLFHEILNVSINEEDVKEANTVIEGLEDEKVKEHIMDLRYDIKERYVVDIEMQNKLNISREKLLKRFIHYLTELYTLYVNQRKHKEETEYIGIILCNCAINKQEFIELHEMVNVKNKDVIKCIKLYTIDFTKINGRDNIVLMEFVEVLTSDASYKYKGENKLMENLLQEIYGTTLSMEQIIANIRRRRNIQYEEDLLEAGKEEGKLKHQKEIIKKSLDKGKTIEEIADFLDITIEEVNNILNKQL